MPRDGGYDVFLSYSMKDRAWVSEFAQALRDAGVTAWFDVAELMPGTRWKDEVEEALRASRFLVVILSPESVDSPWVFFEIGAAVADHKFIIPVVTEDLDVSRVPSLLQQYQFLREPSPTVAGRRVAEAIQRTERDRA
ncbi:MAG: toll/interleukin-1 receptor domain-containing protein [Planctomycetota bacterium]